MRNLRLVPTHGRSGRLINKNDNLIEELINDSNYIVNSDGSILTLVTRSGNLSVNNQWREAGYNNRNYRDITYKKTNLRVHRIIYRKFVGPLSYDLVINHIDGNSLNNRVENLELVTQSQNNLHRYRVLKRPGVKSRAKINQAIAEQIRADAAAGMSYRMLIRKYSLCRSSISYIVNNQTWKSS